MFLKKGKTDPHICSQSTFIDSHTEGEFDWFWIILPVD